MLSDVDVERIADALAERVMAVMAPMPPAALLTRDELATALKVSPQTVARLVSSGMPVEHVGDLPRFDLQACRTWLAARPKKEHTGRARAAGGEDLGPIRICTKAKR